MDEKPRPQEILVLYKPFNTLWGKGWPHGLLQCRGETEPEKGNGGGRGIVVVSFDICVALHVADQGCLYVQLYIYPPVPQGKQRLSLRALKRINPLFI